MAPISLALSGPPDSSFSSSVYTQITEPADLTASVLGISGFPSCQTGASNPYEEAGERVLDSLCPELPVITVISTHQVPLSDAPSSVGTVDTDPETNGEEHEVQSTGGGQVKVAFDPKPSPVTKAELMKVTEPVEDPETLLKLKNSESNWVPDEVPQPAQNRPWITVVAFLAGVVVGATGLAACRFTEIALEDEYEGSEEELHDYMEVCRKAKMRLRRNIQESRSNFTAREESTSLFIRLAGKSSKGTGWRQFKKDGHGL